MVVLFLKSMKYLYSMLSVTHVPRYILSSLIRPTSDHLELGERPNLDRDEKIMLKIMKLELLNHEY